MTTSAMGRPTPGLDPATARRLALTRLLFLQGVGQAQLPEPLNATSVLALHDASELLLGAIADHLGASLSRHVPFMDHWRLLAPDRLARGVELPARHRMERVNELRNALKHRGVLPSTAAVEQARSDVEVFLEDSTLLVFGIPFAEISMAAVIPQNVIRDKVNAATTAAASGNLVDAMGMLAEAYDDLFSGASREYRSFASFGSNVNFPQSAHTIAKVLQQPRVRGQAMPPNPLPLARQIEAMTKAIGEMQRGLRVMALGIDFRQFVRFERLTPRVLEFLDGHRELRAVPGYAPTREEFDYCCQFVVTAALRIAELDVHAARPEWWPGR